MKLKILLLLIGITFQTQAQISVSSRHVGTSSKFKKGVLEKFKKTETIFLLSTAYSKETYGQIKIH
ncbi:MAG: hypothetical protein ACJA1Z_003796 [Patiriisocius sp.]